MRRQPLSLAFATLLVSSTILSAQSLETRVIGPFADTPEGLAVAPDGTDVELWSSHPLLNWSDRPYSGYPIGVNVLVLDRDEENLYVATDAEPMVLRIPIESDGSAGEPVVVSSGHSPFDGIEFDDRGNIYVSEILRNEIWVLSPDGSERMLVANKRNAPLDEPTSLIWHDGTLCVSNLGFSHFPDYQAADRTVVCMEGFERP